MKNFMTLAIVLIGLMFLTQSAYAFGFKGDYQTIVSGKLFVNYKRIIGTDAAMVKVCPPNNGRRIVFYGNRIINRGRILGKKRAAMVTFPSKSRKRRDIRSMRNRYQNFGSISVFD